MHRFLCYPSGGRGGCAELHGAYLVGADGVPVRGELHLHGGEIRCETRSTDPIGLSLLWPVNGFGTVQLQTTRLPTREQPYHLHVELARHQLMRITLKREEWGLFDYSGMDDIAADISQARALFVQALEHNDDAREAAKLADQSLSLGLAAAQRMCQFHASVFLGRRQQSGGFAKQFLGVGVGGVGPQPATIRPIVEAFDFVRIPLVWRDIQPTEQGTRYDHAEAWLKAAAAAKLAVRAGPLLNFGVQSVPDWMYIWENDFESIYEAARDLVSRTVQRFAKHVPVWIVASGLHADSVFSFNFEQVMELTRMAVSVTKQLAPRSQVLVDLTQPWGEYYARFQQTIPPFLYADMALQGGINFDGFGLQFLFGANTDGYHLRDLLQVSALIDKLANLGKPLHVTAVAVPSTTPAGARSAFDQGGQWREPWSEAVQAEWLTTFCEIALSKPYVESVCLQALADGPGSTIAGGGVLREDLTPKAAHAQLGALRKRLQS